MSDLEKAKEIFYSGNYSFVLVNEDNVLNGTASGLRQMIELADGEEDYSDWSICDKVTGRAAAFLYVMMGLKAVHAKKMAKLAIQILDRAEIEFSYDELIETVLDPQLKETDPFEACVLRSSTPIKALEDLKVQLTK